MIENSLQLINAETKMADLANAIVEAYELGASFDDEDRIILNSDIGGKLRRMGIIHADIHNFLKKKKKVIDK